MAQIFNRWATQAAGKAAQEYIGTKADMAFGFSHRAAGLSLPSGATGKPSAMGAMGELMGMHANGAMKTGMQYATNQRAQQTRSGGSGARPTGGENPFSGI